MWNGQLGSPWRWQQCRAGLHPGKQHGEEVPPQGLGRPDATGWEKKAKCLAFPGVTAGGRWGLSPSTPGRMVKTHKPTWEYDLLARREEATLLHWQLQDRRTQTEKESAEAGDCGARGEFLVARLVKNPTCNTGDPSLILGWEDPLEKDRLHSNILGLP